MKLSDYFKIVHPQYCYLRLIPDTSIRNYNSSNIAKAIAHMYKGITQRIAKEEKKIRFECPAKASFLIDIRKDSVNFYFVIPIYFRNIAIEKIKEVWPRATVEDVQSIQQFSGDRYQLVYKKEDSLSLNVDRKSNEPLNCILNVIDIMQENDRIGIFYNFMPCSQLPWNKEYNETINKVKNRLPVDREKVSGSYILKVGLSYILYLVDSIIEIIGDFFGVDKKVPEQKNFLEIAADILRNNIELSPSTKKKKENLIIDTQMMIVSQSNDKTRQYNNLLSVCQSYKALEEDNELIYKNVKGKNVWNVTDFKLAGIETNRMSVDECSNFIQLPGRDLLQEYKKIKQIDILEVKVPVELQNGVMCIGTNTFKGSSIKAFLSNDREYKNLTLCIVGPTRSGKTTLISNLARDAIKNNECSFIFDFCGNCELSDEVAAVVQGNVLKIDCSDYKHLQGIGYNEAKITTDDTFLQYENAKSQTSQVLTLINSINPEDKDLTGRMDRYLEAASLVVFISGGSVKDVFQVLKNHLIRTDYINKVPEQHKENFTEYVETLKELDDIKETKDKDTKTVTIEVVGTRLTYVSGIFDRVNKLKRNTYMELMLKKDCSENINLINEIQKPQLICLRMPENMFSTEIEKDIFCTYWITKIWLALQIRKSIYKMKEDFETKTTKVNIFLDELYQVPQTQEFLRSKLSQIAKFKGKPIISCHHLKQIPGIRQELKAANTSYMLIQGCNVDNYAELKNELEPYALEDLLNLQRYRSLNLLRYEGGYAKFITKLPPPIS